MTGPDIFDVPPARAQPLDEIVSTAGPLLGRPTLTDMAAAARLPLGQQRTIQEAKRQAATHPSLHAYANLRCRCEPCVAAWNRRMRIRNRAVSLLIARHEKEFRQLWNAEMLKDEGEVE